MTDGREGRVRWAKRALGAGVAPVVFSGAVWAQDTVPREVLTTTSGGGLSPWVWLGLLAVAVLIVAGVVWGRARRARAAQPWSMQPVSAREPVMPRAYSPQNVGNDAAARPWEYSSSTFGESAAVEAPLAGEAAVPAPAAAAGLDVPGFLETSKQHFIQLQDAWDRGDVAALRAMMTEEMIGLVQGQLAEREQQAAQASHPTEVVLLEAQLLGMEESPEGWVASVEFSGMIRDEPAAGPSPFREVWSITRTKQDGQGWRVAGVQAMQ